MSIKIGVIPISTILLASMIFISSLYPAAFAAENVDVIIPYDSSVPGCEKTGVCFMPSEVTIKVGETVIWSNGDSAAHTVTSGNPTDGPDGEFDSSLIMGGAHFNQTFYNAGGEYNYFCMVHPWMTGKIIVSESENTPTPITQTGSNTVSSPQNGDENNKQVNYLYEIKYGIIGFFANIFPNSQNNKQDANVFRALGETIQEWTDDFDQEKKALKEKQIQNEIDLAAKQRELEQNQQQLAAERLAKEQKQIELEQRQQQLDSERLAKEQKQYEIEQQQRQLEEERLVKEQQQYEIEQQQRQLEEARLAKEQQQRELEQQQRQLEEERLIKEQQQRELEQQQRQLEEERLVKEQQQRDLEQQQRQLALQKIESEKQSILAEYSWSPFIIGGLTDGEITFYVQPLPSYASDDVRSIVEAVTDRMDGLTVYGGKLKRIYQEGYEDFSINWVRDYQGETIGRQVGNYLIIGLGTSNCNGDWMPFNGYSVYKIMWHEVGHALGYDHVSDTNNIMNPIVPGIKFDLEQVQTITLPEGSMLPISLCESGRIYYTTNANSQDTGYKVYVVPPNTDPYDIISGKGLFYTSCSAYKNEMTSFSQSCSGVPNGSYLLIHNPTTFGLGSPVIVDLKIYDRNEDYQPDFNYDESHMYFNKDFINYVWNLFHNS